MSDPKKHQRRCGSCNGPLEADARFCGACGHPVAAPRRPAPGSATSTRRRIAVSGVVTIALGLMIIVLTGPFGGGAPGSSSLFDDGPQPVRAYLLAEGAPLVHFHTVTAEASEIDVGDAGACESLLAEITDMFGDTPERLLALAAATPDETTAHLLINDIAAKRDLLASCVAEDVDDAATFQAEVERSHENVSGRIAEAGLEVGR